MNWPWLQVLVVFATPGLAYYHELSQRVFKVSLHPDANFGFSISSISHGSKAKLVVGAPLADNIGQVFTCDLTENTEHNCTTAKKKITRFTEVAHYDDQNYWYGATVKGTDDFFVACSPLQIDKNADKKYLNRVGTFGQCYLYKDPTEYPQRLSSVSTEIRKKKFSKFEEIMDSFGWTLDIDSENSIWIGGPAMISGRLIKIKSNQLSYTYGQETNKISYNFGYGVASGFFLASKLSVAVGSPYGSDGHGKVLFLDNKMTPRKELLSPEVGSMFGAVLCTVTLTSHRKHADLLVGAPAYADNDRYNIGAVYVYIAAAKLGQVHFFKRIIVGAMSQSYFGNAIVSVGDLNGDKMDEIAIAAPYENEGRGAVYLYSGEVISSNKDHIDYLQKIIPEPRLKAFGFSLAALRDYDDNGCNELAIGIPGSNQVKVLHCIAAIAIKVVKFKYEMPRHNGKDEIRRLPVCITAEFPDKPAIVKADIQVNILIQHDGARLYDPAADSNVTIKIRAKKKEPYCKNINLFMSGTTGNYNKKITYGLKASLKGNVVSNSDFNGSEVILSDRSVLEKTGFMIVQECGDKLCEPKLKMNTTFSEESSEYELGSSPTIDAAVWVMNTGDVAYDACVRVSVTGAKVSRPPDVCQAVNSADNELECKPKQALRINNPPWSLEIISLDTTTLTNENKTIKVKVTLYKTCETLDVAEQNTKEIQLIADAKAIHAEGRTNEGVDNLVNLTRSDIEAHKSFQHVYTIINSGRTTWVNVKMSVIVLKRDFVTRSVSLGDEICLLIKTDNLNEEYSCVAPRLNKDARIEVKVIMQVVPDELNDVIGKGKITVSSSIDVQLDETTHPGASVTSELKLVEGVIPIWIIIAASIMALIILLIIFFILRECGFLERKNKEDLKRVRMSVRRQTMIRHSMMNRPLSQDQKKLVEDNEAALSQENKKKKKERRVVINDN